ncbi:formin-like protein 18 [Suricata suricatta]|uniref:formin-like protein 18 n=1 Tax=Suricata suricatta TaxID=37032 RepID=UPI00115556A4|nr:formin-like protein 18 [Suricata suricatta]
MLGTVVVSPPRSQQIPGLDQRLQPASPQPPSPSHGPKQPKASSAPLPFTHAVTAGLQLQPGPGPGPGPGPAPPHSPVRPGNTNPPPLPSSCGRTASGMDH